MSEPRGFQLLPDDLLFLRDGKPSTRGSDHYLTSVFPPAPSTLYGALRTRRLVDKPVALTGLDADNWSARLESELVDELGDWGGFGSLHLRGPWLTRGGVDPLVPAPGDLGVVAAEERGGVPCAAEVVRFRLEPVAPGGGCSHAMGLWGPYERRRGAWQPYTAAAASPSGDWWLSQEGLAAWAEGGVPEPRALVHRKALWLDEVRTGVGLQEGSRQAKKRLLYTFGFVRLAAGIALGFDVSGTRLEPEGGIRLGGEGKTAALTGGPSFPPPPPTLPHRGRFVLAFVTPAISAAGAYPPGAVAGSDRAVLAGFDLGLAGALVRGSALLGGWNIAERRSKPLRRAIPAGSVYVFDDRSGGAATALWGTNLSDFAAKLLAQQGFGLAVTGAYPD